MGGPSIPPYISNAVAVSLYATKSTLDFTQKTNNTNGVEDRQELIGREQLITDGSPVIVIKLVGNLSLLLLTPPKHWGTSIAPGHIMLNAVKRGMIGVTFFTSLCKNRLSASPAIFATSVCKVDCGSKPLRLFAELLCNASVVWYTAYGVDVSVLTAI
ncbi:hypothetical protein LENED_007728 [Lentinula edodes]|uniref:Uncharacterized protein n=1 Tax=Lentinula edodes TaxID=5353 RepID=A0A1Q3EF52_LENED|nr:hypothetical protein LENED_007728 [Lentinula edodes]